MTDEENFFFLKENKGFFSWCNNNKYNDASLDIGSLPGHTHTHTCLRCEGGIDARVYHLRLFSFKGYFSILKQEFIFYDWDSITRMPIF